MKFVKIVDQINNMSIYIIMQNLLKNFQKAREVILDYQYADLDDCKYEYIIYITVSLCWYP